MLPQESVYRNYIIVLTKGNILANTVWVNKTYTLIWNLSPLMCVLNESLAMKCCRFWCIIRHFAFATKVDPKDGFTTKTARFTYYFQKILILLTSLSTYPVKIYTFFTMCFTQLIFIFFRKYVGSFLLLNNSNDDKLQNLHIKMRLDNVTSIPHVLVS